MLTKDFNFDLPEHLIAQVPSNERGEDRLLFLERNTGALTDHDFANLVSLIEPGTLLVFNDSRVRRARVFAEVEVSGSQVEFLLLEPYTENFPFIPNPAAANSRVWKVMAKKAKRQKPGRAYKFPDGMRAVILEDSSGTVTGEFRLLEFDSPVDDTWLDRWGHIPLPPYIRREDCAMDSQRYQTVYAKNTGSVAAPTAGLHFTPDILDQLDKKGIERTSITLHVGLGTFLPVRAERLEEHQMHKERFLITQDTAMRVERAKKEGRPVLAVGTTSVRTLESAWDRCTGTLAVGEHSTEIFIYPGYTFGVVDQLFTNFHTPESTLLMLVSAFAGKESITHAYAHAVQHEYRFFSYGDSMLIR